MKSVHFALQVVFIAIAVWMIFSSIITPEYNFYWLYWMLLTGFFQGGGTIFLNIVYGLKHSGFRNHLIGSASYLLVGGLLMSQAKHWHDEKAIVMTFLLIPSILLSAYYTWLSYRLLNPVRKGWLDI
jgi:hypothetical protein